MGHAAPSDCHMGADPCAAAEELTPQGSVRLRPPCSRCSPLVYVQTSACQRLLWMSVLYAEQE